MVRLVRLLCGALIGLLRSTARREVGRKVKLSPHQQREALARREAGEALTDIGRTFGVSHSTISRLKAENERLHSRNRWLDAQVTTLRKKRDAALAQDALCRRANYT